MTSSSSGSGPSSPGSDPLLRLSGAQRAFLEGVLGPHRVRADHGWSPQSAVVLEVEAAEGLFIVKAAGGGVMDGHLIREIRAHREVLHEMADMPRLVAADAEAGILVTRHLPGRLVQGSAWEHDARVYRSAGRLVAALHAARPPRRSGAYQRDMLEKALGSHRRAEGLLDAPVHAVTGRLLSRFVPQPVDVVPTHGDVQPRNWLVDPHAPDGSGSPRVHLIDFGRAERRPWYSDLVRLHHQEFRGRDDLAEAFFAGAGWRHPYPVPAADRRGWLLENLLQSLGTVTWATGIGDTAFADQGRRMLERVLEDEARG